MSKFAATTLFSCRTHIGWLCAGCSVVALLPSAVAVAATPDPALRRSEQIDSRRLGNVSTAERSVLRVEWRAQASRDDEARTVQELLDSLRRMEATVAEIKRLLRSIPAPAPLVAVAPEAAAADEHSWRLAVANAVAAGLVALWWLRRRNAAKAVHAKSGAGAAPLQNPEAVTAAIRPVALPNVATGPAPTPAAAPQPRAEARAGIPREPRAATVAVKPEPSPPPIAAAPPEPAAATKPAAAAPIPAQPAAEIPPIEFSLEEADPAAIALANARMPKPAPSVPRAPRKPQDSNVEPTLELAEIMLSMGLAQGAAQALVEYSEANPRQALYHWLKLLDIYRSHGDHDDFKETAEKLRQHFNIQAEDWTRASTGEDPSLENFSRVSEHVQQIWSRPEECRTYLRHLLEDNREGSRAGFPRPVAEEILLLIEILKPASTGQAAAT